MVASASIVDIGDENLNEAQGVCETPDAVLEAGRQSIFAKTCQVADRLKRVLFFVPVVAAGLAATPDLLAPRSALAQAYDPTAPIADGAMPSRSMTEGVVLAATSDKTKPTYVVESGSVLDRSDTNPEAEQVYNDFNSRYGIPLITVASEIQDRINKERGIVVKSVQMRITPQSSLRDDKGGHVWGKIMNGLGDTRLAPPRSLQTLYAGATDPVAQIENLVSRIANDQNPENFAWRTDRSADQLTAYRTEMAALRVRFLDDLKALSPEWRQIVSARMVDILDTLERQIGQSMPMGMLYRVVLTSRLDRFAELDIVQGQLSKLTPDDPNRRAYENRRAVLLGSVRNFSDLSNILARTVGVSGALAIRPDILLPDPKGEDKTVTIGHFQWYKPPAGRGIPVSTTQGFLTNAGMNDLAKRFPMLGNALKVQTARQAGLIADTINEFPKHVEVLDTWAKNYWGWMVYANEGRGRLSKNLSILVDYGTAKRQGKKPGISDAEVGRLIRASREEVKNLERAMVVLGTKDSIVAFPAFTDIWSRGIVNFRDGLYDQEWGIDTAIKDAQFMFANLDPQNKYGA